MEIVLPSLSCNGNTTRAEGHLMGTPSDGRIDVCLAVNAFWCMTCNDITNLGEEWNTNSTPQPPPGTTAAVRKVQVSLLKDLLCHECGQLSYVNANLTPFTLPHRFCKTYPHRSHKTQTLTLLTETRLIDGGRPRKKWIDSVKDSVKDTLNRHGLTSTTASRLAVSRQLYLPTTPQMVEVDG
ncbi:hypothetical protein Bbelb_042430 [Branchiostoma belcheri]|nr:hypothetical protein Bbelb_042430 [Branchiostoma belcheri]